MESVVLRLLEKPALPLLLPFIVFLFLLYKLLRPNSTTAGKLPLLPSPPTLPFIGNLHQLGKLPHQSLRFLSQQYGDLMLLHLGGSPAIIVSSANAARQIMKIQDSIFSSRPPSRFRTLLYDGKDMAAAPYGEYWRQVRSICVLHVFSNKRVQSFRRVREEETLLMVEEIKKSVAQAAGAAATVNLSEVFAGLTNDVVCRVAFGRKYRGKEGGGSFKRLLKELGELMGGFYVGDLIPCLAWTNHVVGVNRRVEKVKKELDELMETIIEEHLDCAQRNGEEKAFEDEKMKDLVDVLVEVQKDNNDGSLIDRESIKAILLDMFAAGTDTTYTSLDWAMVELLRHPGVMAKLQKEIREVIGNQVEITEDNLGQMRYLKAVIKETLRLHPPLPLLVPRESVLESTINGYNIPASTQVIVNAWAIHRDPEYWEDPEDFRPERFLNSLIDFKGHDFQFIPFGAGRRGCPAISFATTLSELALANLMYALSWGLPNGETLDMTETPGITVQRKQPLLAVATQHCF